MKEDLSLYKSGKILDNFLEAIETGDLVRIHGNELELVTKVNCDCNFEMWGKHIHAGSYICSYGYDDQWLYHTTEISEIFKHKGKDYIRFASKRKNKWILDDQKPNLPLFKKGDDMKEELKEFNNLIYSSYLRMRLTTRDGKINYDKVHNYKELIDMALIKLSYYENIEEDYFKFKNEDEWSVNEKNSKD